MVNGAGLFDTNILIDHLNAVPQARTAIENFEPRTISVITWIEVMTGVDAVSEVRTRSLLSLFRSLPISPEIAERAAILRRQTRLKLADAIILATAEIESSTLVTRDERDFIPAYAGIHVPYRL